MVNRLRKAFVRRIASSHFAGPSVEDAIGLHRQATACGWTSTLGYFDNPHDSPESTARAYRKALAVIGEGSLSSYISIKLPCLKFDTSLFRGVMEDSQGANIRVHLDSLSLKDADPTFRILEDFLPSFRNLGITIPARWRRSTSDAERIIGYGIPVRVVKGLWKDPDAPDLNVKENFLSLIDILAGRAAHVAVATHDASLAEEAVRRLLTGSTSCEIEQMSSLPQNCAPIAKRRGLPMRVYIPYGYPSLPYNLRHAATRPTIIGWAIRDFILGPRNKLSPAK